MVSCEVAVFVKGMCGVFGRCFFYLREKHGKLHFYWVFSVG